MLVLIELCCLGFGQEVEVRQTSSHPYDIFSKSVPSATCFHLDSSICISKRSDGRGGQEAGRSEMGRLTGLRAAFLNYKAPEPAADSEYDSEAGSEAGRRSGKSHIGRRGCGRERVEYTTEEDEVVTSCPEAHRNRIQYCKW